MKIELTREESQHLLDLGVPKEKASIWNKDKIIFKLDDFLNGEILPKEITHDGYIYKLTMTCGNRCEVRYETEHIYHLGTYIKEELIDSLYELTCWYYGEYLKSEKK